ncbi:MAG: endolytic transglycosylase MltG [bacterium]
MILIIKGREPISKISIFNSKEIFRNLLFFGGFIIITFYCLVLFMPWKTSNTLQQVYVTIHRGMTPRDIASLLEDKNIIANRHFFVLGAKLLGVSRKLQAGKYSFNGSMSNYVVLKKFYEGDILTKKITIPEGLTANRIAKILNNTVGIDSSRFMDFVNNPKLCDSLGINAQSLEGYLYPNTYRFYEDISAERVITHLIHNFKNEFNDTLQHRAEEMDMKVHEVVTLASIVQGEVMVDKERPIIAALYLNRLEKGMRLQADPCIQYIIDGGPRRLLDKDLEIDSPYNTYMYSGLPPGPVNNPGIASIRAVLFPAQVNYLFMVANGDGTHTFSESLLEHNRAKLKFDRYRNKVNRKK